MTRDLLYLRHFARTCGIDESGTAEDLYVRVRVALLAGSWTIHWFDAMVRVVCPTATINVYPTKGHVSLRVFIGWRRWWPWSRRRIERRLHEAFTMACPMGITYNLEVLR